VERKRRLPLTSLFTVCNRVTNKHSKEKGGVPTSVRAPLKGRKRDTFSTKKTHLQIFGFLRRDVWATRRDRFVIVLFRSHATVLLSVVRTGDSLRSQIRSFQICKCLQLKQLTSLSFKFTLGNGIATKKLDPHRAHVLCAQGGRWGVRRAHRCSSPLRLPVRLCRDSDVRM
jgi:hypothetical protein